MPGKGCSTQRPVGRDLLVGEARLSLCRMGLEPRDPSRSKLVALPELGCGQHTQARETAAPRAPSGLLVGGFSSARREDWTSPLHLPPLWSHGCDPAPLCWELGPQGLATTAYQDPGHPYRAQLGGPFSQNSKLVPSTCNSSLRDGTISHRKHSSVWRSPRDTASESSNSVVLVFPSPTPNSPACGGSSCWGSLAHQCHPPTGRQLLQGQPAPHPEEEGTRGKTPRLPFLKMFLSLSERWLYSLINQSSNLKCLRHYAGASWDLEVSDEHHSTEKQFKFSL
ncbi:uncharacterized protein LOC112402709 [Neophocaena asiaeorientalis asiaeorientalis]|uniref:Uncharacterized protein LOC112402709 n=1 Tax=Neophocaena asiaeorientalis asiaeorientalis TaxID=1706337 RepID=A0A341BS57_NEOAA|nr:uncharacterized protein LOC112402709 [Neophocaena asiaeorientalis asiaeorientalis]